MIRKKAYINFMLLLASAFALVACTQTCVGLPELGSKKRPVRFYLDGWDPRFESVQPLKRLSACLETYSGYRVAFEIAADEKAVGAAMGRGEADFGFMSSLGYLDNLQKFGFTSQLLVTKNGGTSTRTLIVGKANRWRTSLGAYGLSLSAAGLRSELALSPINGGRFVYLSPESDVGFFVPRHMLFQRNIFPDEAIFAGTFDLVLQSVERDIAIAGAVTETFLEEKYPQVSAAQVGSVFGEFVVLALSQNLPGKVVVSRRGLPQRIISSVVTGLETCAKEEARGDSEIVFAGDGFVKAHDRTFDFLREIQSFQEDYVRVLSSQE